MFSTETLGTIRTVAFAASGLTCAAYALALTWLPDRDALPAWTPIVASIGLAVMIFGAFAMASKANADAAQDEGYRTDNLRAAALGFWSALAIGSLLWVTKSGGAMQLAITLTGASAVYMLAHVVFDLRGRAWR